MQRRFGQFLPDYAASRCDPRENGWAGAAGSIQPVPFGPLVIWLTMRPFVSHAAEHKPSRLTNDSMVAPAQHGRAGAGVAASPSGVAASPSRHPTPSRRRIRHRKYD